MGKSIIPTPSAIAKQTLLLLAATVAAAWIISKFPGLQALVKGSSITVDDQSNTTF